MQEFSPGHPISLSASVQLIEANGRDLPVPMVLKRAVPSAPETVAVRFETAAQVLPHLITPHVPVLRASGLDGDSPYLLMDRVPGESLADLLRRGPLPQERLVAVAQALARAVHAVHLQGAVHQHLIPGHVMVTPDQGVVLLSFGLAHHPECPDLLPGPEWVQAVRSPWMAPEQLYQVRGDPRSDQWSVGALIYHMAVGHPPWFDPANPEASASLERRMWHPLVPLRQLRPDLPAWLQEIVHRCLETALEDRYDHCGQVAWALAHPHTVQLAPARSGTGLPSPIRRLRRWWAWQRDPAALLGLGRRESARAAQLLVLVLPDELAEGGLRHALRQAAGRLMLERPDAHLACLTVLPGTSEGTLAESAQRRQRMAMQRWAQPLHLSAGRLSLHVLSAPSIELGVSGFCHHHMADLLVVGWGDGSEGTPQADHAAEVALALVAVVPCSVMVVRPEAGRHTLPDLPAAAQRPHEID